MKAQRLHTLGQDVQSRLKIIGRRCCRLAGPYVRSMIQDLPSAWIAQDLVVERLKRTDRPLCAARHSTFRLETVMFGSDWPVCLYSATYEQMVDLFEILYRKFLNLIFFNRSLIFLHVSESAFIL